MVEKLKMLKERGKKEVMFLIYCFMQECREFDLVVGDNFGYVF